MFGWNLFLIRDKDGNINAFHNICRHRGHPVTQKASGSSTVLACRFHGWSYLPNGDLHKAREYSHLPDFDPKQHSLFKIHTHVTAQGFIFVNFDARETPAVSFEEQFGDDFDPAPTTKTGREIGDEFALFPKDGWEYDHTWNSSVAGTEFNWKTFADGFQECYHCQTGHPTTLPKDFALDQYYLRQGIGASRHFLPPKREGLSEAYITWLYPIGAVIFSDNLLFIARYNAAGALETSYQSETYRRSSMQKPSPEYDHWMEHDIGYWRFVEIEDVELAVNAQKGFKSGVLGLGRLHSIEEHAVKWYLDKVRAVLVGHAEAEKAAGKNIDYSVPQAQSEAAEQDELCKLVGPEYEW
ncbi:uncharacterized protein A1O5_03201 [Cladophialophora psammophila CBS 110553]|uniref:Choline monooxygenase, chloroplastic n=1 Tax=Cladophialophora psammophila CBS 110553 TaxID=1182543 RepID=W9X945_9EURO|nr:uncharacterized protein A1O5_03201 [Cladophialophora psammophila CBS 110553]EXJ73441.1 hypothetical protein A1O5_03201 [Cladophialophora psammophila CBS 110553]